MNDYAFLVFVKRSDKTRDEVLSELMELLKDNPDLKIAGSGVDDE